MKEKNLLALEKLDALFGSLQQRAFRGGLPDDELPEAPGLFISGLGVVPRKQGFQPRLIAGLRDE